LLALRELFPGELAASPEFVGQVQDFLSSFYERGARAALAEALRASGPNTGFSA
jgi:hypothetical protein